VNRANAEGGVLGREIEAKIEGFDYSDLKKVANATQKLLNIDKVSAILTTWSEDTEIVVPLATSAGVPLITVAAGARGITARSPILFRVWPSDEGFVRKEVEYALKNGKKRAAMIVGQSAYFLSLSEITTELWSAKTGSKPSVQEVSPTESDFGSVLTKIRAGGYDVLFMRVALEQMGNLLLQAHKHKLNILLIGRQTSDSSSVLDVAKETAEGLIFPAYEPASGEFIKIYRTAYNEEPGPAAEYAFDAVNLLLLAISRAGTTDGPKIVEQLYAVRDFAGASGIITFNSNRDRETKTVILKRIEAGKGVDLIE